MKINKKFLIYGIAVVVCLGTVVFIYTKPNATTSQQGTTTVEETKKDPSEAGKEDVVIATVNGKSIYQSDLDEAYENVVSQYTQMYGESEEMLAFLQTQKVGLLDSLINRELLLQKADELKITVTDEEVNKTYQFLIDSYGAEQVDAVLSASNLTEEAYKEELRTEQILTKVQEEMQKGDISVTEGEITKYYEENVASFTTGAGANMQHLLVKFSDSDSEDYKKQCEEAATKIEQEIKDGATFEQLKAEYTADGVDKNMYIVENLGFVQYEQPNFDPAFLAGAKEVKEGQLSNRVKSSFGYHFIQVDGIKEEVVKSLEEVKDSIKSELEEQKKYNHYQNKLTEWTNAATIERFEDCIQ